MDIFNVRVQAQPPFLCGKINMTAQEAVSEYFKFKRQYYLMDGTPQRNMIWKKVRKMSYDESVIREIVARVVREKLSEDTRCGFEKEKDQSGILKIKTDTVKCEPFAGVEGVGLKDIVTLDESPHMGAGVMELQDTSFEWTLNYDEYDIVLDGVLEIEIDGRIVRAQTGDVVYIPSGSHIHFQTPSKARYVYITYPADWQA